MDQYTQYSGVRQNLSGPILFFAVGCMVGLTGGWLALRKGLFLDDLTGLPNRRAIMPTLKCRIRRSMRRQSPLCVALLDIDHFKTMNTKFGYAAADGLLRDFAKRMNLECHRKNVDLLRYRSGDEFLLVMNDMDEVAGRQLLKDLSLTLSATPFQMQSSAHGLTFTAGMLCFDGPEWRKFSDLHDVVEELLLNCEGRLASGKASNKRIDR